MITPGGNPDQNMEVDSEYNGDPTPEQIMDIDATETGREIRRRIVEQVHAVRRVMRPNDPLICELLIPRDLAESTFKLPAVEKILHEFLPLEEAVNELLSPQINWAPPGYKPSDKPVRRAMARLWAIRTDGDGDCLLHSVSLSLWGLHDRTLVLRSLVVEVLQDRPSEKTLFKIWREGQRRADAAAGENASFEMEEDQVVAEWHMLVEAANTPSAYLSSFHAFVLANALRRPILVYGDRFVRGRDGEPYAPSDVRGVYLPTLLDPDACYKLPIAVGYTCVAVGKVGHFTALVGVDRELRHLPLVDEHGENLPIRYGLPQATLTNPDPEGDAMDEYMTTTTFFTEERIEHRMATLRGAYMTPEADGIRRTMALMAEAAFDRLAKAQEEEIRRASQDEGAPPPPPIGDSLPLPPPPLPTPPAAAAAAAAAVNKNGEALPPPESNTTPTTSGSPPSDDRVAGVSTGIGGTAVSGSGATEDRGANAGTANIAFGAAAAPATAQGADESSRSRHRDDNSASGVAEDGGVSETLPKSSSSSNGGTVGTAVAGSRSDSSLTEGAGADGEIAPAANTSPPVIGSRFLSAPLGVLSAVGAWATGRSRSSVGSAADGDAASAAAAAAAAGDRRDSKDAGLSSTASGDYRGISSQGETTSTLSANTAATGRGGDNNGAGKGGRADARPPALKLDGSAREAPALPGGDHDTKGSTSGGRRSPPPDVRARGEMDLESPPPHGRSTEGAETAVSNGKRKPVSSPAVTPDGPNAGQHFGDTDGGMQPVLGEEEWRVGNPADVVRNGAAAGSRRSKERSTSSSTAHNRTTAAGAAAGAAAETDDSAAAVPLGGGGSAISRHGGGTSSPPLPAGGRDFRAVAEAYQATERWRASSSRSAGTRRGQPHPRGNHDAPGGSSGGERGGGGGGNPWLERAPTAAATERRLHGEEHFLGSSVGEGRQRYPAARGSSSNGGGATEVEVNGALRSEDAMSPRLPDGGSGNSRRGASRERGDESKPRANGGGRQPEVSASSARYHSRTRLRAEGRRGGSATEGSELIDGDPYRASDAGSGRVVRDGMDTMSLSNDRTEGDRRRCSSDRALHGQTVGGEATRRERGSAAGDSDIYRHERDSQGYPQRTESLSTSTRRSGSPSAAAAAAMARANGSAFPPPELPQYSLYPRAPPPTSAADSVHHGRRATRSSSLSRGPLPRSNSSSGSFRRSGALDNDWSVIGDDRVSRGGSTRKTAEAKRTSYYYGSNGTYTAGGSVDSTSAAAAYHSRDADWREREREALATSRLLSSSTSASHRPRVASSSGRSSSPGPRPAWKSDSLRRALERPSTSSGRSRSPWATASSSSAGSSSSYLALAGGRGAAPSLNVPGAVARELSARTASRSSRNSVRSNGSSSGSAVTTAAAFDGQTLSSLRRTRAAQERRAMEVGAAGVREGIHAEIGASRPRTPYTPKFY